MSAVKEHHVQLESEESLMTGDGRVQSSWRIPPFVIMCDHEVSGRACSMDRGTLNAGQ